jgi:hypothetical protein
MNASRDYLKLYDLEGHLFDEVGPRFRADGTLSAFDFFCIVIRNANRAKSIIAKRLIKRCGTLDAGVLDIARGLAKRHATSERLRFLFSGILSAHGNRDPHSALSRRVHCLRHPASARYWAPTKS